MQHECKMKTPDALEADLLARFALFLSTIGKLRGVKSEVSVHALYLTRPCAPIRI